MSVDVSAVGSDSHVELRIADDGAEVSRVQRDVLEYGLERPVEHADGLRLWLVQWAVARSGGQPRIEDDDRGGSPVVVVLPRASSDTLRPARPSEPPFLRLPSCRVAVRESRGWPSRVTSEGRLG